MKERSAEWIEALTQHSGWVRALARSLVSDEHLAEDLLQDAALARLQVKIHPEHEGWLAGTVRNLAANMRRGTVRRERREERAGQHGTAPSAAESAALVEQQRLLADAVLALEEPFRDVVLLRFYDGLPQREIAKKLGVPKATVNSRLRRAVHKLRVSLDAQHGGDRKAWVGALTGLGLSVEVSAAVPLGVKLAGVMVAVVLLVGGAWILSDPASLAERAGAVVDASSISDEQVRSEPDSQVENGATKTLRRSILPTPLEATDGIRIQVVDAATGKPVPSAEVWVNGIAFARTPAARAFRHESLMRRARLRDFYSLLPRQALDEEAAFLLSDPPYQESLEVYARDSGREGRLNVSASYTDPEDALVLPLWPVLEARVKVIDSLGRAQFGVPVGMIEVVETRPPEGAALINFSRGMFGGSAGMKPQVYLAFPLSEPRLEKIAMENGKPQNLTLTMPEVGSVRVFVSVNGAPVEDGTLIHLSNAAQGRERTTNLVAETQDSIAEFWPVGLGMQLRAALQLSWETGFFGVEARGPELDGESVDLYLEAKGRLIDVVGRLVNENGEPFVDSEWYVSLFADGKDQVSFKMRTDAEGRFLYPAAIDETAAAVRMRLDSSGPGVAYECEMLLPAIGEEQSLDLGDMEPRPEAVLLEGITVNTRGEPVAGVIVGLVRPTHYSSTGWEKVGDRGLGRSGANGRFSILGKDPGEEAWLGLYGSERWVADPVRWKRDGREMRLVIERAGILEGRILVDPDVAVEGLGLEVWLESGPGPVGLDSPLQLSPSQIESAESLRDPRGWVLGLVGRLGKFSITGLWPGTYTFALYLSGRRELIRLSGVEVQAGKNTDPRLAEIDLRGAIRVIDLDVRDEEGKSILASALVYLNEDGKRRQLVSQGLTDRPILLSSSQGYSSIRLRRDGYFPVTLGPIEGKHQVPLSRGIAAPVKVHGVGLLEEPYCLELYLLELEPGASEASKRRRRPGGPQVAYLDVRGRADTRVQEPGEYEVRMSLKWRGRATIHFDIDPSALPRLTVPEGGSDRPFTFKLPPDAVPTAMAALRKRVQGYLDSR